MACLEILLDKPQTLEPGVTAGNMHDKSVDYFYLVVIQLKKQPAHPKAGHQNFHVWTAKGYLVLFIGWKGDAFQSLMQAGLCLLSVWRSWGAVQGEPELSEKNPCSHPFGLSALAWFMRRGLTKKQNEGKSQGFPVRMRLLFKPKINLWYCYRTTVFTIH